MSWSARSARLRVSSAIERVLPPRASASRAGARGRDPRPEGADAGAREPQPEAVEIEVDDGRRVERQQLAHEEAADDRDAERPAELRADARAEREREPTQQRRHRG